MKNKTNREIIMSRNMSFSITTKQARNKTKTVTRRIGWWFLKPGDIVQQVEKGMGLKKGEKVKKIHLIKIKSVRPEPLYNIDKADCAREGFPGWTPGEFIRMFCTHNKCKSHTEVNRIEFEYI
jgi:hypothetical protein